eukprot:TRINITY_DN1454_c0_g1_i2.p1 TRINITY_DN1454_c0_g1~~TRINITY_DN1454_c0_g1_i2.p1  ORF type:complete len:644 (+),score=54.83 TRINITY_DN1454_c0_g1_i2:52-1983(+)
MRLRLWAKLVLVHFLGQYATAAEAPGPALVLYEHIDRDDFGTSVDNMRFFLKLGLLPPHRATFIFIATGCHSIAFPTDLPNVHVIDRPMGSRCGTIGAWHAGLIHAHSIAGGLKFSHFVLLSSRVRGPFLPSWAPPTLDWLHHYSVLLKPPVALVGPIVSCEHGLSSLHLKGLPLVIERRAALEHLLPILSTCPGSEADTTDLLASLSHCLLEAGRSLRALAQGFLPNIDVSIASWPLLRRGCSRGPPFHPHPLESLFVATSTALRDLLPPLLTQEVVRYTRLVDLGTCDWRLGKTKSGGPGCATEEEAANPSPCLAGSLQEALPVLDQLPKVDWVLPGASGTASGGGRGVRYRSEPATVNVHIPSQEPGGTSSAVRLSINDRETMEQGFLRFCSDPQPMDTAACGNLMDQYLGTLAWYEPVLPSQAYHPFLSHIRFLQDLVRQHNYKSYLEIGCQHVARFSTMSAMVGSENSVWIDSGAGPHQGLDGSTFKQQHAGIKFDLVFVEGSHGAEHALSSIRLALSLLTPDGAIVVHNTNPRALRPATPPTACCSQGSCGADTFRAIIQMRQTAEVDTKVGDFDYGVALIRPHTNTQLLDAIAVGYQQGMGQSDVSAEEWAVFKRHRTELLRLVPVEQFWDMDVQA